MILPMTAILPVDNATFTINYYYLLLESNLVTVIFLSDIKILY